MKTLRSCSTIVHSSFHVFRNSLTSNCLLLAHSLLNEFGLPLTVLSWELNAPSCQINLAIWCILIGYLESVRMITVCMTIILNQLSPLKIVFNVVQRVVCLPGDAEIGSVDLNYKISVLIIWKYTLVTPHFKSYFQPDDFRYYLFDLKLPTRSRHELTDAMVLQLIDTHATWPTPSWGAGIESFPLEQGLKTDPINNLSYTGERLDRDLVHVVAKTRVRLQWCGWAFVPNWDRTFSIDFFVKCCLP